MSRNINKGPFFNKDKYSKEKIKIKQCNNIITYNFVGENVLIYNGRIFIPLKIVESMVGYRFGEFISTRVSAIFKKRK